MTQAELQELLDAAKPGDVIDLDGATVTITEPPLRLPDGIALANGVIHGGPICCGQPILKGSSS